MVCELDLIELLPKKEKKTPNKNLRQKPPKTKQKPFTANFSVISFQCQHHPSPLLLTSFFTGYVSVN